MERKFTSKFLRHGKALLSDLCSAAEENVVSLLIYNGIDNAIIQAKGQKHSGHHSLLCGGNSCPLLQCP